MASWKPKKVGLLTSQRQSAADLLACECFETHGDVTCVALFVSFAAFPIYKLKSIFGFAHQQLDSAFISIILSFKNTRFFPINLIE